MRVNSPAASLRQRFREDRGVTSAIFVLIITMLLGMTGFVVDLTSAWMARRTLVTTTDAAALAAAQDFVEGQNGCVNGTAQTYVTRNNAAATMTACAPTFGSGGTPDRITVAANSNVNYIFAPAIGLGGTTVASSTTVSWDLASRIDGGLRPFGLCAGVLAELTPTIVPGNGVEYQIFYGKDAQPDTCGDATLGGNWGILDFDGGANPLGDTRDWTEFGYDGSVSIGDIIDGDPGAYSNALRDELDFLITVDSFTLPVFDLATGTGAGAQFRISDFAAVSLIDYLATGPEEDRYFTIEFLDAVVQGGGGGDPTDLGAYVIGICAVDGINPVSTCQ